MNTKKTEYEVRNLIARNEIDKAIRMLIEALENTSNKELYHEALIASERYLQFKKQKRMGTIHDEFSSVQISRVIQSLLEINSKAFGKSLEKNLVQVELNGQKSKDSWIKRLINWFKNILGL